MSRAAVYARITGRVQGVSFRAWTLEKARALQLSGWVRNEADGSVSGYFAGDPARLDEMVSALHDGPRFARVDAVETAAGDPEQAPADFRIEY